MSTITMKAGEGGRSGPRSAGLVTVATGIAALVLGVMPASALDPAPSGVPDAVVDLATHDGVAQVRGTWKYSDARIVETAFRAPGADRKPSGPPNRTQDLVPKAGAAEFDDAAWTTLDPTTLEARRSTGRVSFAWYRIRVTVPERVGAWPTSGSTAVFSIVVDDHAEVWVDGKLPRELGQTGGSMVAGWNAPNRVVLGRGVKPGQSFQVAVFAMNGPISDPPANFIWVRSARLEFYAGPRAVAARELPFRVERKDAAIDAIVAPGAMLERVAENFTFGEGPVWAGAGRLLLSDPNANQIYEWRETAGLRVFRDRSGYQGADVARYRQPGSNGLTFDREGRRGSDRWREDRSRRECVRLGSGRRVDRGGVGKGARYAGAARTAGQLRLGRRRR